MFRKFLSFLFCLAGIPKEDEILSSCIGKYEVGESNHCFSDQQIGHHSCPECNEPCVASSIDNRMKLILTCRNGHTWIFFNWKFIKRLDGLPMIDPSLVSQF